MTKEQNNKQKTDLDDCTHVAEEGQFKAMKTPESEIEFKGMRDLLCICCQKYPENNCSRCNGLKFYYKKGYNQALASQKEKVQEAINECSLNESVIDRKLFLGYFKEIFGEAEQEKT